MPYARSRRMIALFMLWMLESGMFDSDSDSDESDSEESEMDSSEEEEEEDEGVEQQARVARHNNPGPETAMVVIKQEQIVVQEDELKDEQEGATIAEVSIKQEPREEEEPMMEVSEMSVANVVLSPVKADPLSQNELSPDVGEGDATQLKRRTRCSCKVCGKCCPSRASLKAHLVHHQAKSRS